MPILAHLDLDAFFAAVEELEKPELRRRPLVVGGDPRSRGVVATANYVARRFGIHSAMSCAEALRRCPQAVFVRPRHTLYREYSAEVWTAIREVVPVVERTGLDEGYLDLTPLAADFGRARSLAEAVRTRCARRRASRARSASRRRRSSQRWRPTAASPAGSRSFRPGPRRRSSRRSRCASCPGSARGRKSGWAPPESTTIGGLGALSDLDLRAILPGQVGRLLRDRALGIDPRGLELTSERISISVEETFERDLARPRAAARRAAPDGRSRSASYLRARRPLGADGDDEAPLRRLLDPQPLDEPRRSGSTTPTRIGELACSLLDRGLRDRPGALRLVGVGVSGLSGHRQLSLEETG